jgi:hypothetical protein
VRRTGPRTILAALALAAALVTTAAADEAPPKPVTPETTPPAQAAAAPEKAAEKPATPERADTPPVTAPSLAALPASTPGGRNLYLPVIQREAKQRGLPPEVADAVARVESAYEPSAIGAWRARADAGHATHGHHARLQRKRRRARGSRDQHPLRRRVPRGRLEAGEWGSVPRPDEIPRRPQRGAHEPALHRSIAAGHGCTSRRSARRWPTVRCRPQTSSRAPPGRPGRPGPRRSGQDRRGASPAGSSALPQCAPHPQAPRSGPPIWTVFARSKRGFRGSAAASCLPLRRHRRRPQVGPSGLMV